jgi:ribosomal protein S18 acetylase RimI-like enzyme
VALRPLDGDVGEVKRLYIRPGWRGQGLGRLLVARVIEEARAAGYGCLRLDTLPSMAAAQALYRSFGFELAAAYLSDHAAGALCLERRLG